MTRPARTPAEVIVDVLRSAQVSSEFTPETIAESILQPFALVRIEVSTADEHRAAREAASVKPSGPIETLRYEIGAYEGNELAEVLGRESLVTPATAAFDIYVQNFPTRHIIMRDRGRVIRRSDETS
jgi:hypothetical protein